jgi:Sec-independent protein translocase protein TatA
MALIRHVGRSCRRPRNASADRRQQKPQPDKPRPDEATKPAQIKDDTQKPSDKSAEELF